MARVLVVDDQPVVTALLSHLLSKTGYEVVVANSGKQALNMAAAESPDVILLDVMMPEMNGLEVCRQLKANPALQNIPVILLTARIAENDIVAGLDAGAEDYVTKPFQAEILAARLRSALRVKRNHDAIAKINSQLRTEINQRKQAELELARVQRLESLGRLAAGVAHEINTPNQYIGDNIRFLQESFTQIQNLLLIFDPLLAAAKEAGVSESLLAEASAAAQHADIAYLTTEVPTAIRESLDGVEHVARIVRTMSDFSRTDRDQKAPLDINEAIRNTLILCRNQWKDVADLTTELDPALPPVPCVASDFNELMVNLLTNAAQAIADAGHQPNAHGIIAVTTQCRDNFAEIRINDTGGGIPEEIRSRVFEPFFTTRGLGKGKGQGLAVAHAIVVEKHGGQIAFDTETGRGTTFIVKLPLA